MSLILKGLKGEKVLCGFYGPFTNYVLLGDERSTYEEFCEYAKTVLYSKSAIVPIDATHAVCFSDFYELVEHIITGGIFGWNEIPAHVSKFVEEFPEFREELERKHAQNKFDSLLWEYPDTVQL